MSGASTVGRTASKNLMWLKIQKTSQRNVFVDLLLQRYIKQSRYIKKQAEAEKGLSNHTILTQIHGLF